ncbi:hypothetical protein DFH06DRAFT_1475852 [Mycena polygramma]|nr:hypothetical protein DFH06DRAFT_1475852 [Mycena polygramma]
MSSIPKPPADMLPDEVLATVLKLVTDLPMAFSGTTPPAPVPASHVNQRWRIVALNSPELWTTIRISHRPASFNWAALFVQRSLHHPLDISINLEAYFQTEGFGSFAIVGPHIGRWRMIALRGSGDQMEEFSDFVARSPVVASRLESVHFSTIDWDEEADYWYDGDHWLESLFAKAPRVRSLRVDILPLLDTPIPFRTLHALDLDYSRQDMWRDLRHSEFRQLFGPSSSLTTLVIRNFRAQTYRNIKPIDGRTIRSFAVSFSEPLHLSPSDDRRVGFDCLTNAFNLPNLEYLEIVGGFSGSHTENSSTEVPEDWETPLFLHLCTLRLHGVSFSHRGLALIQSFSRNIDTLLLMHTTGNKLLLVDPGAWPVLRSLTAYQKADEMAWLAPFVTRRAALGMPIADVELPPCIAFPLAVNFSPPMIRRPCSGPSPGVLDGVYSPGFYIGESGMGAVDFGYVEIPRDWDDRYESEEWKEAAEMEAVEENIERTFKMSREVARYKGVCRESRREKRRGVKVERDSKVKQFSRHRRHNRWTDFSVG